MLERSRLTPVTFAHPFKLREVDCELPAGRYEIETVDELLDTVSSVAYRRKSTTITVEIPNKPGRQVVEIDPVELTAILEKDRATP